MWTVSFEIEEGMGTTVISAVHFAQLCLPPSGPVGQEQSIRSPKGIDGLVSLGMIDLTLLPLCRFREETYLRRDALA